MCPRISSLAGGDGRRLFFLRLRHAHSGGPAHEHILDAIKVFGDQVLPYCR